MNWHLFEPVPVRFQVLIVSYTEELDHFQKLQRCVLIDILSIVGNQVVHKLHSLKPQDRNGAVYSGHVTQIQHDLLRYSKILPGPEGS